MLWFLIVVLAVVLVLALFVVLVVFAAASEMHENEQALIELQVRRAERQLHDIARDGFAAMLDEARSRSGR
jgi:flagellar basal body-associated protein FliL